MPPKRIAKRITDIRITEAITNVAMATLSAQVMIAMPLKCLFVGLLH